MVIHDNDLTGNDYEFLSFQDGKNTLRIISQQISIQVCRWKEGKKTLLWNEDLTTKFGFKKYSKIFYLAEVNGKKGILDIPYDLISVISSKRRDLQKQEAISDSRQLEFIVHVAPVVKNGYTTQEFEISAAKKIVRTDGEVQINTQELASIVQNLENKYQTETIAFLNVDSTPAEEEKIDEPIEPATEDVNPDDLPFS